MDWIVTAMVGLIGLAVGSFLNVCLDRLLRRFYRHRHTADCRICFIAAGNSGVVGARRRVTPDMAD